ncbi:unnamed protein product [Lactuca virosa]|uniref:Leucine-rich repeat-containing N-terminal plant-type domain-containing protein n=1 Tax=Lactuca virosa TaxID=75947 RepID=A0AAU9P6W8_9ASTR|nr:unnamed protein product [Lactuca virosa]
MNPCLFPFFSLLLLLIVTTTASQLVATGKGGGDANANGVVNKCLNKERLALLLFKAPLQDPDGSLSTWTADERDCCEWSGVTCNNQTGRVTELDLQYYNLGGEISNSLLNLSYLNHLDLSQYVNSFHGNLPTIIGSMTRLSYLNLEFNNLYGTIPPEFGNLTNLQYLHLDSVGRCSVDNSEWLSHLQSLRMDGNGISLAKQNHWVDVIRSLRKLSFLSLDGYGIPKYLGNLCSLKTLYFDENSAVVKFPDFLDNLSGCTSLALKELDASNSQFTGSLSDDI